MSFALTEHGPYFLDGSGNGPPAERGESSLLRYNQALERDCAISNLNERFLEDKLRDRPIFKTSINGWHP